MPRKTADIITRRLDPVTGEPLPNWYENATVRRPDGTTVRLRGSCRTDDRATARALTADKIRRISLGLPLDDFAQFISLDAALTRYWLEHVCQGTNKPVIASWVDIRRMGGDLLRVLREVLGGEPWLHDLTADEIAQYASRRRAEPQRRFKRPPKGMDTIPLCGPRAVNAELEHLRAVIRMARDKWHRTVDPEITMADGTRRRVPVDFDRLLFPEPDSPVASISVEEQERVLAFCAAPENRIWAHVGDLLQVGIWEQPRRGNLVTLDWSQIDMNAHSYTLATKSKKPGGQVTRIEMTDAFWHWLAARGPRPAGRVFLRWNPHARRLPDGEWQGEWQPFEEFKRAWATVRQRCGLGPITFHQATRKTGATRILAAGGSLADAQLALGHRDIQTTMRYLNVNSSTARGAKNQAAQWYESQLRHSDHAAQAAATGAKPKKAKKTSG